MKNQPIKWNPNNFCIVHGERRITVGTIVTHIAKPGWKGKVVEVNVKFPVQNSYAMVYWYEGTQKGQTIDHYFNSLKPAMEH